MTKLTVSMTITVVNPGFPTWGAKHINIFCWWKLHENEKKWTEMGAHVLRTTKIRHWILTTDKYWLYQVISVFLPHLPSPTVHFPTDVWATYLTSLNRSGGYGLPNTCLGNMTCDWLMASWIVVTLGPCLTDRQTDRQTGLKTLPFSNNEKHKNKHIKNKLTAHSTLCSGD